MLNMRPHHIKKHLFFMLMLIGMYNWYVVNGKIRPTVRSNYLTKTFIQYIKVVYLYLSFTRNL